MHNPMSHPSAYVWQVLHETIQPSTKHLPFPVGRMTLGNCKQVRTE